MKPDKWTLDRLFGEDSTGEIFEERARTSKKMFVRSLGQIADLDDTSGATGLRLSAVELVEIFSPELLHEIAREGTAVILRHEPAISIKRVRERLGLSQREIAQRTLLKIEQVRQAETPQVDCSIHVLNAICKALGLDGRRISWEEFH